MRRNGLIVIGALLLFVVFQAHAFGAPAAYTTDGKLDDWGVALQLEPYGHYHAGYGTTGPEITGTRFVADSFKPSNTTNLLWGVNDNNLPADHGGEFCDVEALYATIDKDNLYFAVVTSSNPNGTRWDGYGNARFGPGDLGIEVTDPKGATTIYGVGARPFGLSQAQYGGPVGYGPSDQRNPASWESVTGVWNDTLLKTSTAYVVTGATWTHVDNPGGPNAYFIAPGNANWTGSDVGDATAAWRQWSAIGDYWCDDPYGKDEPYGTWIYEVCVDRDLLGVTGDTTVTMRWFGVDCGNDVIAVSGEVGGDNEFITPVPEPAGLGLIGLVLVAARRRRK